MKASSPKAKSTVVQLEMFDRATLKGSRSVISLLELEAGRMHFALPGGLKTARSGQPPAHASHSPTPGREWEQKIRATYGRCLDAWLAGADLQSSLENRLRQRLAASGSQEYALTWRAWDMRSGPPICALRASAHRTSGKGCSGWPTPSAQEMATRDEEKLRKRREECKARTGNGNGFDLTLGNAAPLAGWPSPTMMDSEQAGGAGCIARRKRGHSLHSATAGWATPKPRDYRSELATEENLQKQWDHPRGKDLNKQATYLASGPTPSGTPAATGKPAALALNPRFSLWLMGYPDEWSACGARAMQSSRRSRTSSSKQ
jgi:hypothetical protein